MTAARDIPADLDAALARTDWRKWASWPVTLEETNRIGRAQVGRALEWTDQLDRPLVQDAVLLALPNMLGYARAIMLAALAVDRCIATGQRLVANAPEYAYLRTGEEMPAGRSELILPPARATLGSLRRLARTASWSGPRRLARALLRPDAVAVSHNTLLRHAAVHWGKSIGFRHAESFLGAAGSTDSPTFPDEEFAEDLARVLMDDDVAHEPFGPRAFDLLVAMIRPNLERAFRDLAGLRQAALPEKIWSGSGGSYSSRAVGIEVLRRGGRVMRFDHGTPRGFLASPESTNLLELSVSSRFVVATDEAARVCRKEAGELHLSRLRKAEILGGEGDPLFAVSPLARSGPDGGQRPRVVYAPSALMGFRQVLPAVPSDVIYLDLQLRVAEALRELSVELICQPHPEGLLKGRPHPLENVATTVRGNFEKALASADVMVFDYPATTCLWQAVCSHARVVFLDLGTAVMSREVARLFAGRVRVVKLTVDGRNRPVLDIARLREAVLDPGMTPDPMPFRRLLAGDG